MMRILVIGGTGLISTAIVRELVDRGDDVTIYNRGLRSGSVPHAVTVLRGDRREFGAFERQMAEQAPVDCVIDMVCFRPDEAESLLRAFAGRTQQIVFCSTVDVYTKPATTFPITEQAPRSPTPVYDYGYQKALCESIFERAHEDGLAEITMIRPAHTFGEGARPLHSLGFGSYIIDRMRRGMPIIVHGDGQSLWASCHRDDVGLAFANAAGNPKAYGQAYHVAAEEWLTWDRYIQLMAEAAQAPEPELVHIPADLLAAALPKTALWSRENFQYPNVFDNSRAIQDLGFSYTIPFGESARRMIDHLDLAGAIDSYTVAPFYDELLRRWTSLSAELIAQVGPLDG